MVIGERKLPNGLEKIQGILLDIGAADRWIEKNLPATVHYIALDYPATGQDMYGAKPSIFADAAHLPFADEQFDAIVCLEVIEHVPNPQQVLNEISRTLKKGGEVWLSMPFLYPLHDAPFDFQRFTEYGLLRSAAIAGLEVVCLQKSEHAIRTAGLLACLAIAGGAYASKGWLKYVYLLPAIFIITIINLASWLLSLMWPDWRHMSHGHSILLKKS
jgi:SAM-dependent methyltransferase